MTAGNGKLFIIGSIASLFGFTGIATFNSWAVPTPKIIKEQIEPGHRKSVRGTSIYHRRSYGFGK